MLVHILFDITLTLEIVVIPFFFKFSQLLTLLSPGFSSLSMLLNLLFLYSILFLTIPENDKSDWKVNLSSLLFITLFNQLVIDSRASKLLNSLFDLCSVV